MKILYFASEVGFSGIHTLCIGFSLRLKNEGRKLGYMKPLGNNYFREGDKVTDGDAFFIWKHLELEDALEDVCPIVLTPHLVREVLSGKGRDYLSRIKSSFKRIAEGKDVVILQAPMNSRQGESLGISVYRIAQELDAQVVLVERYDDALLADNILLAKHIFGERMIGAMYNIVPPLRHSFLEESMKPYLENRDIPLLGIIPEDQLLKSVSIEELVNGMKGELLCGEAHLGRLVEGVMVGAMSQEHALSFFRKRKNQCVVTGGDRSDIQLAALEANASCLVLSGSLYPSPIILGKAEEMGVPVILVPDDTLTAAEKAEIIIRTARSHEPKKIERISELIDVYVDNERLYRLAGLKQ